jgi:hypothetical protein
MRSVSAPTEARAVHDRGAALPDVTPSLHPGEVSREASFDHHKFFSKVHGAAGVGDSRALAVAGRAVGPDPPPPRRPSVPQSAPFAPICGCLTDGYSPLATPLYALPRRGAENSWDPAALRTSPETSASTRSGSRPAFVLAWVLATGALAWLCLSHSSGSWPPLVTAAGSRCRPPAGALACRSGGDSADVELGDQLGVVEHVDGHGPVI